MSSDGEHVIDGAPGSDVALTDREEPDLLIVLDESTRERELNDLIGAISHEMRTPLTAITGYAATMRSHWDEIETSAKLEFLAVIERQAARLSRLTSDLLSLSRADAGRLEVETREVVVARVIGEALASMPHLAGDVAVSGDPTVVVRVDPFHLEELLVNLVSNAAKYGEPPIEVSAERAGDEGIIRVRDHGDGVPAGFVSRMWDRFARARADERPSDAPGTGLGLAVVSGLVAANLGRVWYEPSEPQGACFALAFPLVTRPE